MKYYIGCHEIEVDEVVNHLKEIELDFDSFENLKSE
jgi:hypothetical protein